MPRCDFTLAHYAEILDLLRDGGYRFARFRDALAPGTRAVVLRHDVDVDPGCVAPLAELEAARGVVSCWLFRLRGGFYNALGQEARRAARLVAGLGHDIGLHFDEASGGCGRPTVDPLVARVAREAGWLAEAYGHPVRVVSFHRPSAAVLGLEIPGLVNAYGAEHFYRMRYLSDSAMLWRRGCACRHARSGSAPRLQVLVHPEWWRPGAGSRDERLAALTASCLGRFRAELAADIVGAP
jgi:hypothetical protein